MSARKRFARFLGMVLVVSGLSVLLSAQAQTIAISSQPVPVGLDYTPDRKIQPDDNAYALGQRNDHLPAAIVRADRIVLRLGERRVYVYDGDAVLDSFPVAIGAPETPTPTGEFEVFQMIENPVWQSPWTGEIHAPGANSALGLRWIGFTELPGGIIGFHGTPTLSSIGSAASNGCVRLTNEDVLNLYSHVRMGMTVVVEP